MTTTFSPAKALAISEAATPGPWRVSMSGYSVKSHDVDVPIVAAVYHGAQATAKDIERWLPNADFIAYARTALPAAARRVLELEGREDHQAAINRIAIAHGVTGAAGRNVRPHELQDHLRVVMTAMGAERDQLRAECERLRAQARSAIAVTRMLASKLEDEDDEDFDDFEMRRIWAARTAEEAQRLAREAGIE